MEATGDPDFTKVAPDNGNYWRKYWTELWKSGLMPAIRPIKQKELIRFLRKLDFIGPYSGGLWSKENCE